MFSYNLVGTTGNQAFSKVTWKLQIATSNVYFVDLKSLNLKQKNENFFLLKSFQCDKTLFRSSPSLEVQCKSFSLFEDLNRVLNPGFCSSQQIFRIWKFQKDRNLEI